MSMMDETMETMDTMDNEEVLDTEIIEDDADYDVVETEPGNHGVAKTAVKAVVGLGIAIGGAFGIRKAVKKRKEKYITNTPAGLIRCK